MSKLWYDDIKIGGAVMKRRLSMILAILCILSACSKTPVSNNQLKQEESKTWNEDEIIQLFSDTEEEFMVLDCAIIDDASYDGIGFVLYVDENRDIAYISFMKDYGNAQSVGINIITGNNSQIEYLGEGKAKLIIEDIENNESKSFIITYTEDGNKVHWVLEEE